MKGSWEVYQPHIWPHGSPIPFQGHGILQALRLLFFWSFSYKDFSRSENTAEWFQTMNSSVQKEEFVSPEKTLRWREKLTGRSRYSVEWGSPLGRKAESSKHIFSEFTLFSGPTSCKCNKTSNLAKHFHPVHHWANWKNHLGEKDS